MCGNIYTVYHKLKMAAYLGMRSTDEVNADLVLKHYMYFTCWHESPIWIGTENIFSPQYIKTANFQKADNEQGFLKQMIWKDKPKTTERVFWCKDKYLHMFNYIENI